MMNYPYSKVIFVLLMIARFLYVFMVSYVLVFIYFSIVVVQGLGLESVEWANNPAIVLPVLVIPSLVLAFISALLPLWLKSRHLSPSVATSSKSKVVEALDFVTVRSLNFRKHLRRFEFDDGKIHLGFFLVTTVGIFVTVGGMVVVSIVNGNLDALVLLFFAISYFLIMFPDDGERVVAPSMPSSNTAKALSRI